MLFNNAKWLCKNSHWPLLVKKVQNISQHSLVTC